MNNLQTVIYKLNRIESASCHKSILHIIDARAKLIITLLFLIIILSVPLSNISNLIIFFIYPIILCYMADIGYWKIMKDSLFILPFIALIGIFNPLLDKQIVFYIGNIGITAGWISFFSIILRGLLSVQAVFILLYSTGFYNICRALDNIGMPSILTIQLLFVYRYMFVLLEEALSMQRARTARSYGHSSYNMKTWGIFITQLLIRTIKRARRIHQSMLSRGFTGKIRVWHLNKFNKYDFFYILLWCGLFIILRFFHPINLIICLI